MKLLLDASGLLLIMSGFFALFYELTALAKAPDQTITAIAQRWSKSHPKNCLARLRR